VFSDLLLKWSKKDGFFVNQTFTKPNCKYFLFDASSVTVIGQKQGGFNRNNDLEIFLPLKEHHQIYGDVVIIRLIDRYLIHYKI